MAISKTAPGYWCRNIVKCYSNYAIFLQKKTGILNYIIPVPNTFLNYIASVVDCVIVKECLACVLFIILPAPWGAEKFPNNKETITINTMVF